MTRMVLIYLMHYEVTVIAPSKIDVSSCGIDLTFNSF